MTLRKPTLSCCLTIMLLLSLGSCVCPSTAAEPGDRVGESNNLHGATAEESTSRYNEYARLIAGLPTPGSSLAAHEKTPAWISYAESIQRSWERFATTQLRPMREWAAQELGAVRTSAVFYPFSGPDVVNVYTLLPYAKTYVLVALEPVGALPDFSALDAQDYFASLQRSLYDYLQIDFFVTSKMAHQIGQTKLRGVLPVLLFFLAREQARVLEIEYVALKPDGTVEGLPAAGQGTVGKGIPGVRLVFEGQAAAGTQTLYYFRCNLEDGTFGRNLHFASFLKGFGSLTTFTKSASYLLASRYCSKLRQFILNQSRYVLQDDSAIPLRDFEPATWALKFFGSYVVPIHPFEYRYQKDLAQVYERGNNVYPLPFGIGYHHRVGTSNLFLAAKKTEELAK